MNILRGSCYLRIRLSFSFTRSIRLTENSRDHFDSDIGICSLEICLPWLIIMFVFNIHLSDFDQFHRPDFSRVRSTETAIACDDALFVSPGCKPFMCKAICVTVPNASFPGWASSSMAIRPSTSGLADRPHMIDEAARASTALAKSASLQSDRLPCLHPTASHYETSLIH